MAFTVITPAQVASGEPTTTSLFDKVRTNLNDHESRIGALELTVLSNEYDAIVSNPLVAGLSTHTSLQDAHDDVVAGGRILYLRSSITEDLTLSKNVHIEGTSYSSVLDGNITFASGADNCLLENFKFTGNLTFNSGSVGNSVVNVWVGSTFELTDNNPDTGISTNFFQGWQE